ncbi:MAG: alpha/beta hydrolase [Pirellulaceae bacterium]
MRLQNNIKLLAIATWLSAVIGVSTLVIESPSAMAQELAFQNQAGWEKWEKALRSPTLAARARAANELGKLGEIATPATQRLIECLQDESDAVRLNSATSLGYILAEPQASVDGLLETLADDNEHVRYAAEWALARFAILPVRRSGARARLLSFESAIQQLDHREHHPRHRHIIELAIEELKRILGDDLLSDEQGATDLTTSAPISVPATLEYSDSDPERRRIRDLAKTFRVSGRMDQLLIIKLLSRERAASYQTVTQETRNSILEYCFENSEDVCTQYAIHCWGEHANAAIDTLYRASVRQSEYPTWMPRLLYEYRPSQTHQIEHLAELATTAKYDFGTRVAAIAALGTQRVDVQPAREALTQLFANAEEQEFLRLESLRSLRTLAAGYSSLDSIESTLLSLLVNENEPWQIRLEAAFTLDSISPLSEQYVAALCNSAARLQLQDYELPKLLDIVSQFNVPSARPFILRALASSDQLTQLAGIRAAGRLGPLAGDLTDLLIAKFSDSPRPSQTILNASAEALASAGTSGIARLSQKLLSSNDAVRVAGLNALAAIGPAALPALDECVSILRNKSCSDKTHCAAALAIGRMGHKAADARNPLVEYLQGTQCPTSQAAAIIAVTEVDGMPLDQVQRLVNQAGSAPLHDAVSAAIAFAAYIDATEDHTPSSSRDSIENLVNLLGTDEDAYANLALQDIGQGAIASLSVLANNPRARPRQRIEAIELLTSIPNSPASSLLPSLADEQIGRVCQTCLMQATFDDGGLQMIDEIVERFPTAESPQVAYRLEKIAESVTLAGDVRSVAYEREIGQEFAFRLQAETEALEFLQPTVEYVAALPEAAPAPLKPTREENEFRFSDNLEATARILSDPIALPSLGEGTSFTEDSESNEEESPLQKPNAVSPPPINSALNELQEPKPFQSTVQVFYGTNRTPFSTVSEALAGNHQSEIFEKLLAGLAAFSIILIWFVGYLRRQVVLYSSIAIGCAILLANFWGVQALRIHVPNDVQSLAYTGEFNDKISLGVCEVSIPESHRIGELESPSILRLEFAEDENRHVVLKNTEQLESTQFFETMHGTLAERGDSLLVFIHGYNVSFEDAARRSAQLAYDLRFPGAPVFYSWPSNNNWYEYQKDRKNIDLSVGHIKRFLLQLAEKSQARRIHLVAHSMGNVGLTQALAELSPSSSPMFNEVILAAPDIDADLFRNQIAPRIVGKMERCTLYSSMTDLALVASRYFNAGQRIGENAQDQEIPGIDVIDASSVDTSLLGHSYYGEETILGDLSELLMRRPIDQRTYVQTKLVSGMEYRFVDRPYMASASHAAKGAVDATTGNGVLR